MENPVSLRSFLSASWLGWKIESNWTDPFLFATYSIIKPLASAGILVIMYSIITDGNFQNPMFAYLYLGNAFYQYVPAVLSGISWTIIDDREHYRTLKYIYIAPVNIPLYLFGRGVAKFITGSFAVLITLLAGFIFLNVPFDSTQVDWPLFIVSMVLGILMLALLGLLLAGITLITARHSYYIGDVVASGLFLFTGAIFPLEVLPEWLRPVGYVLPITYWLELVRRTLVGDVAIAFPTFTHLSNLDLVLILLVTSLIAGVVALAVFKICNNAAREKGLIDISTNY
ncbi:MAG TPA: ABC transporter permease [Anaerolineaceae bacterium]|nr:ABC transporter permease [Anaerolineaceae bacterium]